MTCFQLTKKVFLILVILSCRLQAQNLVSNPGFETNTGFPNGVGQYALATGWGNCNGGGSSDYFHTMGSGIVQLPNCFIGSVLPNTGDACMGYAMYYYSPPDFREYISTQLISPMVIGQTYNVNFYLTNGITSGTYGGGGISEVGVCFSTTPLTQIGVLPVPVVPQVVYGTVYYSYTWQLISMQFVADSAYQFMSVGNFSTDALSNYQQFDPCGSYGAYYFLDDFDVEEANVTPVALFSAPNHICPGTCTDFTNLSLNGNSYLWTFPGANPAVSTDVNPTNICYNTPGTYNVSLIATNAVSSDTLTLNNFITIYPYPAPQGITQSGDTLFANQGAVTYQWYFNGTLVNGATDYYYIAPESGSYNVVCTDVNNCEVEAVIFDVVAGTEAEVVSGNQQLEIYPNPVKDKFTIRNKQLTSGYLNGTTYDISIYDLLGEIIFRAADWRLGTVDCRLFLPGIYILEITSGENIYHIKFIKK
ncbi:MAG: T9SS type A sorting domain-containing protein [Bacteroidota bacterium]